VAEIIRIESDGHSGWVASCCDSPVFLLLLCFWLSQAGAAFAAAHLAPGVDSLALDGKVFVLEDPAGALSFADVKRRGADFRPSPAQGAAAINFGYSSSVWWLRLDIEPAQAVSHDWLLEVAFSHARQRRVLRSRRRAPEHRRPLALCRATTCTSQLRVSRASG
jgi:hypothetical protein